MSRRATFFGSPKALAGGVQTVTFTSSEIDGAGVIDYCIGFSGAGNDTADIDRIRLRAGSQILVDLTMAELLAYQLAYTKSNYTDTGLSTLFIPLNLLDGPTDDLRDSCQFPPGAEPTLEIVCLGTMAAGSLVCGWETTNVKPRYFPRIISKATTSPISTRNNTLVFSDSGKVRGIIMPKAGVDRAELTVAAERAWSMPGAQFNALTIGDVLSVKDVDVFGILAGNTYVVHSCDLGLEAPSGASNLVWDTGAGWTANSEIALYSVDEVANFMPSRGRQG